MGARTSRSAYRRSFGITSQFPRRLSQDVALQKYILSLQDRVVWPALLRLQIGQGEALRARVRGASGSVYLASEVGCSRGKAIAALKANGGDIVEAVMSLSG